MSVDERFPASTASVERRCSLFFVEESVRTAHELLALVRPSFRLVPRPSPAEIVVTARREALAEIVDIVARMDHRQLERAIRDGSIEPWGFIEMTPIALRYFAQSILSLFLGQVLVLESLSNTRAEHALDWMRPFMRQAQERSHFHRLYVESFTASQRFIVASSLRIATQLAQTLRGDADIFVSAAEDWLPR